MASSIRMLLKNPSGQVEDLIGTSSTPLPIRRIETSRPSNLSSLGILTACERPFANNVVVIAGLCRALMTGSTSNSTLTAAVADTQNCWCFEPGCVRMLQNLSRLSESDPRRLEGGWRTWSVAAFRKGYFLSLARRISMTIGRMERTMMPRTTSSKFCLTMGMFPKNQPAGRIRPTQRMAPVTLKNMKER